MCFIISFPSFYSLENSPSIFSEVMLDFNFGAAPLNSDPSDFMLMFVNPGSIPAEWYVHKKLQKTPLGYAVYMWDEKSLKRK